MGSVRTLRMSIAAGLLAVSAGTASAKGDREARLNGAGGKPMLAVVAISDQRITVYGADGKVSEAPVSTGTRGYETPPGIFTIVQKKEHHFSNLYEDGEMPFMQRITWTGIALHAGALPGYPASHGCVRLPRSFARQLFDVTDLGMRVVVVRNDIRPSDFAHPLLFMSRPVPKELGLAPRRSAKLGAPDWEDWDGEIVPGSARHLRILRSIAAAMAAEREAATERYREARAAAVRAASEAKGAARRLQAAERNLERAESALLRLDRQLEAASSPGAKERAAAAKEKALAKVGDLRAKLETVRAQGRVKQDAAERASEATDAAAAARSLAAQAAEDAERDTMPVSVFVSRKTQRLYVRRGTHPVFEGPVAIRDAGQPIGTFVFTALEPLGSAGEMRWNVVAMYEDPLNIEPAPKAQSRRGRRSSPAAPTDVSAAKAALDRIDIDPATRDIILGAAVLPGSSLIVSDEGPSRETGKDTDFVVVMSGEPQGALKVRKREPTSRDTFNNSPWGGPSGSPFSSKGSPFFWKW